MLELTCAMPLYRSRNIAWLALESLCRQEQVNFEWELVIAQEKGSDSLTEDEIRSYEPRLAAVGCKVPIKYIELDRRVALSHKWKIIGEHSDSKYFLLTAGDDYSNPLRLRETRDLFEETGADWVATRYAAFYNLATQAFAILDYKRWPRHKCGVQKALRTEVIKNLPPQSSQRKSVDGWLWDRNREFLGEVDPITAWNDSDSWKKDLYTDSANKISISRRQKYRPERIQVPFRSPEDGEPTDITEILPKDISKRLTVLGSVIEKNARLAEEKRLKNIKNYKRKLRGKDKAQKIIREFTEKRGAKTAREKVEKKELDREEVAQNLADIMIYVLSLSENLDIDLADAVEQRGDRGSSRAKGGTRKLS